MIKNFCSTMIISILAVVASAQSGGDYAIKKSVVAGGGGTSVDAVTGYGAEGLVGQPIAGPKSSGGIYGIAGGFYSAALIPSAAGVSVSGRVTGNGRGVRGAKVNVSSGTGLSRSVTTGARGEFIVSDLEAGATYVISVGSRRYSFIPQVVTLADNLTGVDFIAQ